jgi:hypothetical protein
MKRKFFGFGSPASFSKELDAESLLPAFGTAASASGRKNGGGGTLYISFFYISSRP